MNIEKIGPALSALVLASVALIFVLGLNFSPNYSDFIVGNITWNAANKFQDLIVWPVFIFVLFLFFIIFTKIITNLHEKFGENQSFSFANQLILISLPFYAGIGNLFLNGKSDIYALKLSALGIVFISIIAFFNKNKRDKPDPKLWGIGFLAVILISIIPFEIAILLNKTSINIGNNLSRSNFISFNYGLFFITFLIGLFFFIWRSENIKKYFAKILFAAQIGLPIFFASLYPARLLMPSGEISKYQTTIWLKIFLISIIVIGLYDVIRRFNKYKDEQNWKLIFSPIAIFALIIVLKVGNTNAPTISPDDYHFGESLLGWWSYLHGAIPYVDYMPAHGIIVDDFRMFLSWAFYDGSAGSINEAGRLNFAIFGFLAFISIYYYSRSLILAFTCIMLLGNSLIWLFIVPFICIWLNPKLLENSAKWLAIYIITAPVLILAIPPQGLLVVITFGLLALVQFWKQICGNTIIWKYIGYSITLLLILFLITPLFSMLRGAITYVMENGPINQVAYGIPWSFNWDAKLNIGFTFEIIRMSWVALAVLCLYIAYRYWRDYKNPNSHFYPAVIFLLLCLLLIPYSMGRIDITGISRPGRIAVFTWAILFPLLFWGFVKNTSRVFVLVSCIFICSLLGQSGTNFYGISASTVKQIQTGQLQDSEKFGLGHIGYASVDPQQWDRLNRLKLTLDQKLLPKESYLDLTSRNAQYFYLNRLPLIPVTAAYNMPSVKQQKRAIENLRDIPKITLLWADNIVHDGGGLALRDPYLYRFAINNYVPRYENGFIIGYRKSDLKSIKDDSISAEIRKLTDKNWSNGIHRNNPALILDDSSLVSMLKIGDKIQLKNGDIREITRVLPQGSAIWFTGNVISSSDIVDGKFINLLVNPQFEQEYTASLFEKSFAVKDFQKIPVSWGKAVNSLNKKMVMVDNLDGINPIPTQLSFHNGAYQITGNDPQLVFNLSSKNLSGEQAGLLKFDFTCLGQRETPRLQIFWWGDERNEPFEASSIKFTAENGTLIVPLDASPWWLTLKKIKGLRIDLDNASSCRTFSIKNIALYQRLF